MTYVLNSCKTEERIVQNIYIHNSNRNCERINYNNNIYQETDRQGYKNYKKQWPKLEFRLIPKLISWAGLKPKNFKILIG